ncbi:uncharacterized protein LOC142826578 [Pelodiscus sinensis]|uniref:uncharacterized protein LOC142826578 n=1 Tax=Pelodiscus sinensis TaxID=13735 RepID=UPI003F6B389C
MLNKTCMKCVGVNVFLPYLQHLLLTQITVMSTQIALLEKIHYTPREAGSFGGVNPLFQAVKKHSKTLNRRQVTSWLSDQDAYSLHKPARIHFKRDKTIVSDVDAQWQADLVDMHWFSKRNSGFKYILTVIDILSKYAWALGLKDKTGKEVAKAFKAIFSEGRVPQKLQTARGKEFLNKPLSGLLKRHGVHHFVTNNEVKAGVVERFNRTLKSRMWRYFTAHNTFRYIDILSEFIKSYSWSFHRTIRTRPADVNPANSLKVWKSVYGDDVKIKQAVVPFRKGDHVRLSKTKGAFKKGYEQTFTDEIFIVDEALTRGERPVYRLKDYEGETVTGSFYPEELQKVNPKQDRIYRIEKVLAEKGKGRKKQLLVKWLGWPNKFNSWVEASQLCNV